jgi:uncharacterized coiled-coil protein SlyX
MAMAENETRLEYLHRELGDRLARLESSLLWYRKRHYISQMSTVVLSACITIIAGFKVYWITESIARNAVLILGAIVTVISAWGAFFSPREFWHLNSETYSKLRALQAKLEFLERGENFQEKEVEVLDEAFTEYQKILDQYNQKWREIRGKS